jgi:aquaporin Z
MLSEFLGTYFLTLTAGLNVLGRTGAASLSIASSVLVMVYSLGSVSGAHFNPAVTVAMVWAGRAESGSIPRYFAAQILGGLLAAFTFTHVAGVAIYVQPGGRFDWYNVAFIEGLFTCFLAFVVLNVTALSSEYLFRGGKAKQVHGLAVGLCIVAAGNAGAPVSGGWLNPAVVLALDISQAFYTRRFLGYCLLYSLFQLGGGVLAAATFLKFRKEDRAADAATYEMALA